MVTLGLEHVKEALAALDRAVALDPEYADAWSLKGTILGFDIVGLDSPGHYAEALTAYERALALEPHSAPTGKPRVEHCYNWGALRRHWRHSTMR